MLRRYATAGLTAAVVAVSLFLVMESLIAQKGNPLGEDTGRTVIDFVRLRRESRLEVKKRQMPDKPQEKDQVETPAITMPSFEGSPTGVAVHVDRPDIGKGFEMTGGPSLGAPSDTDTIPMVRINPIYPRRAAERRIEGWVVVEFTINEQGMVENPRVLSANPQGVFESAAIRAIRKWKYKPKIEGGKPIRRPGIRVRLTFDLDDEE